VLPLPSSSNSRSTDPVTPTNVSPTNAVLLVLEPLPTATGPVSSGPSSSDPVLNERYGLLHFRLLYHFEHTVSAHMMPDHPGLDGTIALFTREALTTPYLMEELLAYSAAHKSTLDKDTRHFYTTEATRLQTRALTLYNSVRPEVSDETCLPMFLFSSLLGHHILFDVFSGSHNDLGTVLEGLTSSIGVHRGISAIARSSWPMFKEELQRQFLQTCVRESDATSTTSQGECDGLLKRLETSELSPSSIMVHREATELLQNLFDDQFSPSAFKKGNLAAVQDWLIQVSADYIQCLNQRRPEALVVLAHYAVLLHRGAHYWFVGGLGRRIIHLINGHLGPLWVDWLQWPNQVVGHQ
jgi:hypothetical protein